MGNYQARLTCGEYSQTYPFAIEMNPNLKGITAADLQEQFELATKIKDKTSLANQTVIDIRKIRSDLNQQVEKGNFKEDQVASLISKMTTIEEALYQVKNQSAQDPLNFPIKLNNRLASLRRSMENGDARPTDGAYQVFRELSNELDSHLKAWEEIKANLPTSK